MLSICSSFLFGGFRFRDVRLRFGRCRTAGPGERVDPLTAATTTTTTASPRCPALAATTIPFATTTTTSACCRGAGGPLSGQGLLLRHQLRELPGLQLLGQGAQGKAENGHGGAQAEGFLQNPGGLELVVAQADAEATGFALACLALAAFPLAAVPLPAFPLAPVPTAAARIIGTSVGLGSVGVVGHARSTHSGASVAHRATGRISFGVKPVQGVLAGRRDPRPGEHQQRQGAASLAQEAQPVLLH